MEKVDILNLEWSSYGRDREMITPIIYYLEKYCKLNITCLPIWDITAVDRLRPKMVLMTNTIGGGINHCALKYCYKRGVPVISLTSEGNFFEQDIDVQTWGWNKDKIKYEDIWMVWSEDAAKMALKKYPELKGKLFVSGGIGFDRYKIYEFMDKNHFQKKYRKERYDRIIGYAGWLFGKIDKERVRPWPEEQIRLARKDKIKVNKILKELVENNKEILFVLKRHPAEADTWDSGLSGLNQYPNTVCITNEENIADVMNICDIWLAYDSNTVLESWCLDNKKPTIFINPTTSEFKRRKMYLGVPIAKTSSSLQNIIDEFYSSGKVHEFEKKRQIRDKIINSLIQWDDGLNHVRAGKTIYQAFQKKKLQNYQFILDRDFIIHLITYIGIIITSRFPNIPYFKNFNFIHRRFSKMQLSRLTQTYQSYLDSYYEKYNRKIQSIMPAMKI